MRFRVAASVVVFAFVPALIESEVRADIPPPNVCASAGSECSNAGDDEKQPGVCVQSKCHRTRMGPDGPTTSESDCTLCVLKTAATTSSDAALSAGSSGASGGAESSSATGVPSETTPPHGGCAGCSVSDGHAGIVAFVSIMGAAVVAGGLGARRRARAKQE